VQARAAEAHVLASLTVLTLDQELLAQAAEELARVAAADRPPVAVDRAAIETKLKRVARLYEDGFKTEAEYIRERDALRAQLAIEGAPVSTPKRSSAVALLSDVPNLLGQATLEERRAVVEEVLDVIYLTPHQAMAVRPVESYAPLLRAARLKIMGWWAGWGSLLRDHDDLTIVTGNRFVLRCGEELETLGHKRRQLLAIGRDVVQNVLDCLAKLRKGRVVAIARHLSFQKLPEPLDQIEIGRIGWQIQQLDPQPFGCFTNRTCMIVGCIIEHNQQPLAWIGCSYLLQQLRDPLGITRLATLQANQIARVGRIGPKDVEAIPARVGLELHAMPTLDPALARYGSMQQVRGIEKVDLATTRQRPFLAV
jgi:hypothetical protein